MEAKTKHFSKDPVNLTSFLTDMYNNGSKLVVTFKGWEKPNSLKLCAQWPYNSGGH